MNEEDYPAIYRSASLSSDSAQKQYLLQIGSQYTLLFLAAVASLDSGNCPLSPLYFAIALILSTIMLIVTATVKPEKDWYASRALAESLKTSTWRYMMNAHPFNRSDTPLEARKEFADRLAEIVKANDAAQKAIKRRAVPGAQITETMRSVRLSELSDRIDYYLENRIQDQKIWYVGKSISNRRRFIGFVFFTTTVQASAILLALLRLKDADYFGIWPTEPLLILASALIGWIQIKKFNELASAYSLTAHEIGIIEAKLSRNVVESEWSDFVNEAELAFSREHTQWVARQDTST